MRIERVIIGLPSWRKAKHACPRCAAELKLVDRCMVMPPGAPEASYWYTMSSDVYPMTREGTRSDEYYYDEFCCDACGLRMDARIFARLCHMRKKKPIRNACDIHPLYGLLLGRRCRVCGGTMHIHIWQECRSQEQRMRENKNIMFGDYLFDGDITYRTWLLRCKRCGHESMGDKAAWRSRGPCIEERLK